MCNLSQRDTCLYSVFKHIITLLLCTQSVGNLFHPFMVLDNFVYPIYPSISPEPSRVPKSSNCPNVEKKTTIYIFDTTRLTQNKV